MENIFGKNAVREYLKREDPAGTLYIAREGRRQDTREIETLAQEKGITIKRVPRQALDRRLPGMSHQGLLIAAEEQVTRLRSDDWHAVLQDAIDNGEEPAVVVLDRIQDPQNLGAIVRSAALFGIRAVFIPNRNAASFTLVARKAACGGEQWVPVIEVPNLSNLWKSSRKWASGLRPPAWTATEPSRAGHPAARSRWCWVRKGKESSKLRDRCDWRTSIPTTGRLDSLNVSVAAGLFFQEIFRQRSCPRNKFTQTRKRPVTARPAWSP